MSTPLCGAVHLESGETCIIRMDGSLHPDHLSATDTLWPNEDPATQQAVANLARPKSKKRRQSDHQKLIKVAAAGVKEKRERFTKETGMAAAYSTQVEPRENFERLLYYICCITDPMHHEGVISSDNVWALWRAMDWPEPESRQFVGPTMKTAQTNGWIEKVGESLNRSGNGHSRDPNGSYVSKIYAAEGAVALPAYQQQTAAV